MIADYRQKRKENDMLNILTSAYFIVPVSMIAIVIATLLIKRSTKDLIHQKILNSEIPNVGLVYDVLANEFSHSCTLKNIYLMNPKSASKSSSSTPVKPESDIVFVGKCGVLLITVINDKGEFDNPKTGPWHHRFKTPDGETRIVSKINPFDATIPQIRLVSELLADEGIYGKCIKRLVVLTQEKTRTVYTYPEVISINDLVDTVNKLNEKNIFSNAEIRTVTDLLSDYSEYICSSK